MKECDDCRRYVCQLVAEELGEPCGCKCHKAVSDE